MQKMIGCNIENDVFYESSDSNNLQLHQFKDSAIDCAKSCFFNETSCRLGWNYQIESKKCIFIQRPKIYHLRPTGRNGSIDGSVKAVGWAAGFRSCSEPGIHTHL